MIAMLTGSVARKDGEGVVIDVNGVGYRVRVPMTSLASVGAVGESTVLEIHTSVREDAIELFGFKSALDRKVFEKLISVNGVGPRLALSVMSALDAPSLIAAVTRGDVASLKAVKGVGKKTAERLILELRDKLSNLAPAHAEFASPDASGAASVVVLDDLHSALSNLGFQDAQAARAIASLRDRADELSFDELLREALKLLRKS